MACCARAASVRRRKQEQAAASQKREFLSVTQDEPGLAQILHEEINRLPDRYRVPLILCDLEGRTHEQAARHLGWPAGTVKSRLSRARQRLRDRLVRRGPDASAGAMAAFLRPAGLDNLLPRSLASSTTSNAMRFAASRSILGGSAAVLAQGVLSHVHDSMVEARVAVDRGRRNGFRRWPAGSRRRSGSGVPGSENRWRGNWIQHTGGRGEPRQAQDHGRRAAAVSRLSAAPGWSTRLKAKPGSSRFCPMG